MIRPAGKLLSLLKIFCFVLIGFSCNRTNPNLVHNPGFEKGYGSNPDGWAVSAPRNFTNYEAGIDESEFRSGKRSYKISWPSHFNRVNITLRKEEPVNIDPRKNYILSFWYKTEGFNDYPRAGSAEFRVSCEDTPSVRYSKAIFTSDRWRQYYIFLDNTPHDANSLELSFSASVNTEGTIWFDDIELKEATARDVAFYETWRRQSIPDIIGDARNKMFDATGFYRVEKAEDRWWLVDPEGRPAWAIAIAGRNYLFNEGPTPGVNPVTITPLFTSNYGKTPNEINEKLYQIFQDKGFNAFDGQTDEEHALITRARYESGEPYIPMTHILRLSFALSDSSAFVRDRDGNIRHGTAIGTHSVADPFNPHWRKAARKKAEETIPRYRVKPWFLGWFIDNEMSFNQLYRFIWAEYSSREFIKKLEEKYSSIDALNKAWTSSYGTYMYTSFNDILSEKPEPSEWDDPLWADFAAFERHMMKEYIDFTYDLVKELDPNHLIISNRINLGPMPEIYRTADLWGKYDIVCMNIYPDNNKIGFSPGELEIMKKLHNRTGRPILIGEWSVPAIDSELYEFGEDPFGRPLDWSWPQVLRTQKERGEAYEICIKQLASLDFMIGAGWFISFDIDRPERRANRGMINSNFELYEDLTNAMKKANAEIKNKMGL
jgi:hypothetical protein